MFKLSIALVFITLSTALAGEPLFPNDSLDGWHIVGPEVSFTVKDGVLTGEGKGRRNSFLTSEKTYSDFVLTVDVKAIRGNSGIQIRSEEKENRLIGYQIEIDPSERAWSGGLYDEGRRAWLQPPPEESRDSFQIGEWNSYKITCIGPRIKATLNGKETTNYMDFIDLEGHIGFQVHSGDCKVMWRNARILDISSAINSHSQPLPLSVESLFDGESLTGMTPVGGGTWKVEEGAIVGRQLVTDQVTGLLWIDKPYNNFALKLKYKIDEGNSGFFFRAEQIPNDNTGIRGIQVEVDRLPDCGGLYESGGRGWIDKPDFQYSKNDEWNEMMLFTNGAMVTAWINGTITANVNTFPELDKQATEGFLNNFAFQLHKRQSVTVHFKDVEIIVPSVKRADGTIKNMWYGDGHLSR